MGTLAYELAGRLEANTRVSAGDQVRLTSEVFLEEYGIASKCLVHQLCYFIYPPSKGLLGDGPLHAAHQAAHVELLVAFVARRVPTLEFCCTPMYHRRCFQPAIWLFIIAMYSASSICLRAAMSCSASGPAI